MICRDAFVVLTFGALVSGLAAQSTVSETERHAYAANAGWIALRKPPTVDKRCPRAW